MKRSSFSIMVTAFIVCTILVAYGPTSACAQSSSEKILLIPREGSSQNLDLAISKEIGTITKVLTSAGFTVDIATASGAPLIGRTHRIDNVKRLTEVNVGEYAGVILPCMAVGHFPGPPVAPELVAVVKKALAENKPVAANLGSVNVLAEAGVLKGKKYSYLRDPLKPDAESGDTDARFADAAYVSPGLTQDGLIITCGVCPIADKVYYWGTDPFGTPVGLTEMFVQSISAKGP
jgi:putative intracellular protease/amidase